MKKLFLGLSVLALFTATSCKKDKDESKQVTPTKENLTGTYKITSVKYKSGNSAEMEVFNNDAFFEACDRDNLHKLNANLTYQIQDVGTQCTPSSDWTSDWEFVNSTTVEIDGEVYTIKSFDGTTLVGSITDGSDVAIFTFVKQ